MEKPTQNGFTLMELLVTISVAAILLAVGVPGMQKFIKDNRRTAEVNNMIATLQIARSEAVARNKEIGVCASTDNDTCAGSTTWDSGWIVFVDEDGSGGRDNGEDLLQVSSKPEGITVRATFESVLYKPNGRAETSPGTDSSGDIVFCDGRGADEARVVQISMSGRPNAAANLHTGSEPTCP